jgi:hypothetical protein
LCDPLGLEIDDHEWSPDHHRRGASGPSQLKNRVKAL